MTISDQILEIAKMNNGVVTTVDLSENGILRKMTIKYYPTIEEAEAEMQTPPINAVQMIAIEIEHITGKLVNER